MALPFFARYPRRFRRRRGPGHAVSRSINKRFQYRHALARIVHVCVRYSCFVTRANHPKGWDATPPAWGRKTTVEGPQQEHSVGARTA